MQTELIISPLAEIETELLAVLATDSQTAKGPDSKPLPVLLTPDQTLKTAAAAVLASGEYKAGVNETVLLHSPTGLKAKRLLLVGLGKLAKVKTHGVRNAAGAAMRYAKPRGIKEVAVAFPTSEELPNAVVARAIAEGAIVGDFDADTYKSDRKDVSVERFRLVAPESPEKAALEACIRRGCDCGREPELYAHPGERAGKQADADGAGPACGGDGAGRWAWAGMCYSTEKLHELKMGAFWAVSQGSAEPPALIVLRYEPEGVTDGPVLGLVGKGITFDTGGISIKPSDNMEKMKYDMAGGAAMLGAMRAIALLKPKVRVIAVVCAAENMPDGKAYKPGDVQTAMSGKTIEIINTDAEGRLVLADGIAYAKQLGATHLIDAATLTGAIGVALGLVNAGAFSNDDATFAKFDEALEGLRREVLAHAAGRRVRRPDQVRHRRHQKHRRTAWRRVHGCRVSACVCRRHAVDSPGHCRPRVDRRCAAVHCQRAERSCRAVDSGVGAELLRYFAHFN